VDAVNGPAILAGTTWIGWVTAPPLTWFAFHFFGYQAAIVTFIVCWLTPPLVERAEPHLVTAMIRSLFFADYYDAD
jgi:hypothetical protein